MSSPAKRRKRNDFQSSPKAIRSLDYFFGKQTNDNISNKSHTAGGSYTAARVTESDDRQCVENGNPSLTDESLARRLQEEWNNEDISANSHSFPSSFPTIQPSDPTEENLMAIAKNEEEPQQIRHDAEESVNSGLKKATLSLQSAASAEDVISSTVPFDESPLTYDPSQYIPELKKHWATEGGDASYALLTRCFILVNSTQSRIKIVDTLVNLLRTIIEGDPDSLLPTVSPYTTSRSLKLAADHRYLGLACY